MLPLVPVTIKIKVSNLYENTSLCFMYPYYTKNYRCTMYVVIKIYGYSRKNVNIIGTTRNEYYIVSNNEVWESNVYKYRHM